MNKNKLVRGGIIAALFLFFSNTLLAAVVGEDTRRNLTLPEQAYFSDKVGYFADKRSLGQNLEQTSSELCKPNKRENAALCTFAYLEENILAIPGHCVESFYHNKISRGFDYYRDNFVFVKEKPNGELETRAPLELLFFRYIHNFFDVAVFRIDPFTESKQSIDQPNSIKADVGMVYSMGYPTGSQLQLTENSNILASYYSLLLTNLDAKQGQSGAPVFDHTHKLLGMIISGPKDLRWREKDSCFEEASYTDSFVNSTKVLQLQDWKSFDEKANSFIYEARAILEYWKRYQTYKSYQNYPEDLLLELFVLANQMSQLPQPKLNEIETVLIWTKAVKHTKFTEWLQKKRSHIDLSGN